MEQDRVSHHSPRPLIFGEVLYDSFPDGNVVLGGAPFNVAWHLQGFGLAPLFVSRVGKDQLGTQILTAMSAWGMETRGVQVDPDHPTGRVVVSFHDNEPSYEIVPEQAYDFIDDGPMEELLRNDNFALLYHGSLIARHPPSRIALDTLRSTNIPAFVDINLRDPWWQRPWLDAALQQARWVKLNEHELRILARGHDAAHVEIKELAEELRRNCGLQVLVVTRGAAGALILANDGTLESLPTVTDRVVDTVGAGDSFSAVSIFGLLHGWPLAVLAERAVDFAAEICRQRGATAQDRELYKRYLKKWGHDSS